jgi:long-subunit fatty acid transport protein
MGVAIAACSGIGWAQNLNPSNLTNSPYSRYGFGKLETMGNATTHAMGDLGVSLRHSTLTNLANPASYTAIDTLTMLFNMDLKAEWTNFRENGASASDWNAGFASFSFHFPLWRNFAMALSLTPYSTVGYTYGYSEQQALDGGLTASDTLIYTNSYSGSGGINKVMAGIGWKPISTRNVDLSLGANFGFIFGTVSHSGTFYIYSGQGQNTYISREFTARGWDATLGMQLTQRISPRRSLVYGLTLSPQTRIHTTTLSEKYSNTDTTSLSNSVNLKTPLKFGVGVSYIQTRKWNVGAEFDFENWSKLDGLDANLQKSSGIYKNVAKFAVGMEYLPDLYSRNYLKTVRYRAGANVKNSYVSLNGDTNMEYTLSAGCGFPINKRSLLNFSAGYTRIEPANNNMMSENYLCFTLGLTFNEFMFFRNKLK